MTAKRVVLCRFTFSLSFVYIRDANFTKVTCVILSFSSIIYIQPESSLRSLRSPKTVENSQTVGRDDLRLRTFMSIIHLFLFKINNPSFKVRLSSSSADFTQVSFTSDLSIFIPSIRTIPRHELFSWAVNFRICPLLICSRLLKITRFAALASFLQVPIDMSLMERSELLLIDNDASHTSLWTKERLRITCWMTLLTYIFNKHTVLSCRTRERTLMHRKIM